MSRDPEPSRVTAPEVEATPCPALFYPVAALDGVIARVRTPGGRLSSAQCRVVANIAGELAGGRVSITNRANLQMRALESGLPFDVLARLQRAGLAASEPAVDHLRNIMASPMAGLDPAAVLDTRPIVAALDMEIQRRPHLAGLPAKFSVGVDGGESCSIAGLPNDILLRAVRDESAHPYVRMLLRVSNAEKRWDLGLRIPPSFAASVVMEVAERYRAMLPAATPGPRLHELLEADALPRLQHELRAAFPSLGLDGCPAQALATKRAGPPIGILPEASSTSVCYAIAPLLGHLPASALHGLAALADEFGSGELRVTPWRSVILPGVAIEQVPALERGLAALSLPDGSTPRPVEIVACAGRAGCAAGATDTVRDARALHERLAGLRPTGAATVHYTGCDKCCAQRTPATISLLGSRTVPDAYDLYAAGDGHPWLGRLVREAVPANHVPGIVEAMLASPPPLEAKSQ